MHSKLASSIKTFIFQPAGAKEVLTIALPMVISSLSWTIMTFVDRMMLRWVSGDAMTAAFQANLIWFCILCFPLGICSYANTFVSQYFGDRQFLRIGSAVWQAIWIALLFCPIILATVPFAPAMFSLFGHSESVTSMEVIYYQTLCFGAGGMLVSQAASAFFSGRGQTQIVMVIDCLFALVNLLLNWVWIFGNLGFPAMGIFGAGLATAVSLWLKAFVYVGLMLKEKYRSEFATSAWRIDREIFRRLTRFGVPSGVQILLDVIGFTIFVMLAGRLGSIEAEASSMAFSISSLAFMPVMGLGTTALILVGQRLGENRPDLAERATWTSLIIGLVYMAVISMFYWFTPEVFLSGFFMGNPGVGKETSAEPSRELAATLLQFVAAYNLFDATFMIMASAIKGAGDTRFVMLVSLCMALALGILTYSVIEVFKLGIFACWVLITAWVCVFGLIFLARFMQGKWKSLRVIEMQHPIVPQIAD